MAESVREFFSGLESSVDETKTAGMNNSYLFDIEGASQWKVDVRDGQVNVTEGGSDADVTISAAEDTFQRIAGGELNPTSAYMSGKLKIQGDLMKLMQLQGLVNTIPEATKGIEVEY